MDSQGAWSQDGRMESTPRQAPSGSLGQTGPGALDVRRSGRRRRPTGQPPPLPRSIQPTGLWWAAAAVALVTLAKVVFGPARRSLGVAVTVWDDAVVRWLAGLHLPGLTGLMEAIVVSTGSAGVVGALRWGTLLALLVLRRIRHLVVFVGSFLAVLLAVRLATVDRPRPFGVDIRAGWGGWAMPSRPVAIFAATLVGVLYTLVPVGRWRQLGKWVATGLVAAFALARIHLGVEALPTRCSAPSSASPCRSSATGCWCPARSSRSSTGVAAPPTWTWAGAAARRSAMPWPTSSG
jgi:hypothetical protein